MAGIFKKYRNTYGQRKVKGELKKHGWQVSRRRIGRIMKEQVLVLKYTVAQFKPMKTTCNESKAGNTLDRKFDQDPELRVIVSDLNIFTSKTELALYLCVGRLI